MIDPLTLITRLTVVQSKVVDKVLTRLNWPLGQARNTVGPWGPNLLDARSRAVNNNKITLFARVPVPVDGNRLVCLVEDGHRDVVTLVPDKVRSWGNAVEQEGRPSDAVSIVSAVRDLYEKAVREQSKDDAHERTVRVSLRSAACATGKTAPARRRGIARSCMSIIPGGRDARVLLGEN